MVDFRYGAAWGRDYALSVNDESPFDLLGPPLSRAPVERVLLSASDEVVFAGLLEDRNHIVSAWTQARERLADTQRWPLLITDWGDPMGSGEFRSDDDPRAIIERAGSLNAREAAEAIAMDQ